MLQSRGYSVNLQTVVDVSSLTAFAVLAHTWYSKKRKLRVPEKWLPVAKVTDLFLYPLKSGHRVILQSAECTISGMRQIRGAGKYQMGDRTLVVYKESTKGCLTARNNPKLILIEVEVDNEEHFVLNAPGMKTLRLDIFKLLNKSDATREEIITFWVTEKFNIIDCGDEAACWISNFLTEGDSRELRLGLHDGIYRRALSDGVKQFVAVYPNLTYSSLGIYADLTSFMVINQASVDELVTRIPDTHISVNNFRPNIVISDKNVLPFEEDTWEWVKVGDVIFKSAKPCTRCILTTVDPETGIKNKNMEPLKTLKSYRQFTDKTRRKLEKDSPVMGVHLGLIAAGIINVGDTVYIPA